MRLNLTQPVIFISENEDPQLEKLVSDIGGDDCIAKNEVSAKLLNKTIQHALERKKSSQAVSHLTTHDQLTGLANRYLFHEHLEHAIKMAKRNQRHFAVLFIDLDKFKLVNDSLGHHIGDTLLIQTAERLQSCLRETDIIARLGNDEFAILMLNINHSRDVAKVAEKAQKAIDQVFNIDGNELFITVSIGIAIYPECGEQPEALLKNADIALYKAKEIGRNQYHFFTSDLNKLARFKLELEKNLRRALINGEFDIHLQPQMMPQSNKLIGAEALLRWFHPKYGFISPAVFIPLLDDLGLLVGLESWVLKEVCRIAQEMSGISPQFSDLKFSVNISGTHFKTGDLKENVYMALQSSSLDAKKLEVELTEDIMIEHDQRNNNLLSELKDLGVSIALDDFGKGYSSLSYLKNFPADILKIDKAFIDHIVSDERDSAIVEAMITLSHKLGIKVVAEGVEEKPQLAKLEDYGCDYIQGYYFAKPMNTKDFEAFMRKIS
jgi:diguanylate cyclase (GGDEF)-like protein